MARGEMSVAISGLPFRVRDLFDPALMSSAFERCLQPEGDDFVGEAEGHDASAHREHVGVVVLA